MRSRGIAAAHRAAHGDAAAIGGFALANYPIVFALVWQYVSPERLHRFGEWAFVVAGVLSQPALALLLVLAPATLVGLAAGALARRGRPRAARRTTWLARALAVGAATLLLLTLYTDRRVYDTFGFHLNGFVWNLLTTPGGVASMGADAGSYRSVVLLATGVLAAELVLYAAVRRTRLSLRRVAGRRITVATALVLVLLQAGASLAYGWSDLYSYRPVLREASVFPVFVPVRFKGLARDLGIDPPRSERFALPQSDSTLRYPREPIRRELPERPWNVLWLCAESLRADMLDPEIMPATWALAQQSHSFLNHVSGGNGTRMGVFSMFYGLPGTYWFSFLGEGRGPVLIDLALEAGYRVAAFTSDDFSYPEFAKTVWARLPAERLHEYVGRGRSWQRDRMNVDDMEAFIASGEATQPFFVFSFFESPHAHYDFPPESVIRRPYLDHLDYVFTDLASDIDLIRNRYVNSVHHLDSQIARLLAFLDEQGLADRTIVIVTGDHGEEFMEQGRWGHNSDISEVQIRVPLVIHVPGLAPRKVTRLTSHLDLPATLMKLLGARNAPETFSLGDDLLGDAARRYALVSDWDTITWLDDSLKTRFPIASTRFVDETRDRHDAPRDDPAALAARRRALRDTLHDLAAFRRGAG